MATRAEIAAALSTVTDVVGYEYRPTTPKPGDAWPLLSGMERADARAFYVTRRVVVFLPQTEQAASEWLDTHVDDLIDALEPVGFVDRVDPTEGPAPGQFSLTITMRGE